MARNRKKTSSEPLDIVYDAKTVIPLDYESYIQSIKICENPFCIGPYFILLIDMATRKVVYASPTVNHVLGYSADEWINSDLTQIFGKFHPDTLATQHALYKSIVDFFENISLRARTKYLFSYNIRIKHKNNHYVHLVLHNRCIKYDPTGRPRLIMVTCFDMTHYNLNNEQVLNICKITANSIKRIYTSTFFSEFEKGILTRKEVEIWNYIQKGLTGKEIAEKLNISVHTVNTHRKKIYKKLRSNGLYG
ncbi:MAG: LuxR C-terminal-related transcriptional regulator [Bacteroidales bacterium]|nr:LuxR C-terminal-related transcriptional regulator [Bacteroidales bacterium]